MHYQPERNVKKLAVFWVTGLLMLAITGVASASGVGYTDRATFNAQGSIVYNSNFQDYGGPTAIQLKPGVTSPGDPFKRGDVTYSSVMNLIVGQESGFTKTDPLLLSDAGGLLIGDINKAPMYNMLALDMAQYNNTPITLTVYTNQSSYLFSNIWVSNVNSGNLTFIGGVVTGEYFTRFTIVPVNPSSAVGITNVTLGHSPAPEPSTYALMGIGGLLIAFRLRKSIA